MVDLRFYLGESGSGKSTKLYNDIIKYSMENPDLRIYIVVPDQFTMQTQANVCIVNWSGTTIYILKSGLSIEYFIISLYNFVLLPLPLSPK